MRRLLLIFFLWFLLLFFTGSASAETFVCLSCHSAMKGKIRTEKGTLVDINVDSDQYSGSVHGGFDCLICHKQFSTNPHEPTKSSNIPKNVAAMASKISNKAKVDPVALAACVECHDSAYNSVQQSVHGKNVIEKKQSDGALCTDCHGSPHYITPKKNMTSLVNKKNLVKTCGNCHENETIAKKYNFGTYILERYYESFHGKKYILGHPNAPTCADCHSYHDVRQWDDPKSPVAWDNRITTCGACHKGATKKFVTAITHKHIGKDNPIPFYFEKGLIVLLLSVFAFTFGHAVIEAFAEIRDRVFRKGKEGHHE